MLDFDLDYMCRIIGGLSGIPIRVFEGERERFWYSTVLLPNDPADAYYGELRAISSQVGYLITPDFSYYGVVNSREIKVIIGPTRQTAAKDSELHELAFRIGVTADDTDDFLRGMKIITKIPLEGLLQMLCVLNHLLNGETLDLEDIIIYENEQEQLRSIRETRRALNADIMRSEETERSQTAHNTYSLEQGLMEIVQSGDSAALRRLIKNVPSLRPGQIAGDQLRQLKNTFIVTATLVARAAIRGGMDIDDALSLSDLYIQHCEQLRSQAQLVNLQYRMVNEYTERVEALRLGGGSKLVISVTNYILKHLHEPTSIGAMAKELYISRPYLSARFREDTGKTLTQYILGEKTEEAKRLLRHSDRTLSAIGSHLGFSSQSHFSRVFKQYTGITPREYREKHRA